MQWLELTAQVTFVIIGWVDREKSDTLSRTTSHRQKNPTAYPKSSV